MSQLEHHRTSFLSSLFVGDGIAALSQLAGRDYDHPYPRACAEMPPNIQPVHRVRAEMLLVAEGELQSQIRSVWASGALGTAACFLRDGPHATSTSYQPTFPGATSISVQQTTSSSASRGHFDRSRARRLPLCVLVCLESSWRWLIFRVREW